MNDCTARKLPAERSISDPAAGLYILYREQERRKRVLGWRHTQKDSFEGEWEQIISWLIAGPERSSGDLFRELQRLPLGRYHPLQIRTHEPGIRKNSRSPGSQPFEEQWHEEVIHGPSPTSVLQVERTAGISSAAGQREQELGLARSAFSAICFQDDYAA